MYGISNFTRKKTYANLVRWHVWIETVSSIRLLTSIVGGIYSAVGPSIQCLV